MLQRMSPKVAHRVISLRRGIWSLSGHIGDAGRHVDALPRSMHEREEWKTVMEVLLSAVEGREPVSLLRIALTLALQESKPMKGARRKPVKK